MKGSRRQGSRWLGSVAMESALLTLLFAAARAGSAAPEEWRPFQPIQRPVAPEVRRADWCRNPIDRFVERERERRGLEPRPEASKETLLRRVTLDLTGLAPTPEERARFLADDSPGAYEALVDRLLESPRHGERWGRHWMDVWRYSDWAGWGDQVRDSQPHIWRWRDWIVDSINADKGYDRMVLEMLAGDEIAPLDPDTLRATGYLARSFKLLSREAWMQEAVDHVGQAFLGVTIGCARCHDHRNDPITQREYYELRAVFEPYRVRIDRVPGEADTRKDGLPRAFDAEPGAPTYVYTRGDDRKPEKDHPLSPGVPAALGGGPLAPSPVALPLAAQAPEKAPHVVAETVAASEEAVRAAREGLERALRESLEASKSAADAPAGSSAAAQLPELVVLAAGARHEALLRVLEVEAIEDGGRKEREPAAWEAAARAAVKAQRWARLLDARLAERRASAALAAATGDDGKMKEAATNAEKAREALGKAAAEMDLPASTEYTPRVTARHPAASTGRRLAFARWIVDPRNPLAARVAVNHIWMRHFERGLVPSANDLGVGGRPASHPELLDWLAAELVDPAEPGGAPWSMKRIHRLIVTSAAYRMESTPHEASLASDPDNVYLWRMPSRRLEAEAVRDNVLFAAAWLDEARGGPELDHRQLLDTRRRSLYYRSAAEKQGVFLTVFDMPGVSECYQRRTSVIPQQALALANSSLVLEASRRLGRALDLAAGDDDRAFVEGAFIRILTRGPQEAELAETLAFLEERAAAVPAGGAALASADGSPGDGRPTEASRLRARELLVHALFNHNDFVTVR